MLEVRTQYKEQDYVLQFEHSLRSLSKWESEFKTSFLSDPNKSAKVMLSYIRCMLLNPGVDPNIIYVLPPAELVRITEYINETRTASSVPKQKGINQETITSELIYYWMVALKINWEAQDWHLSRLMMLIEITNIKMQPPKKQPPAQAQADMMAAAERNKRILGMKED